jgi:hypothetical protein
MPTIGWIDALRTYNAGMPSWCVPRKGTPGYERVMRIRQGEQTKGFKEVLEDLERKTSGKPKKEKTSLTIDLDTQSATLPTIQNGSPKTEVPAKKSSVSNNKKAMAVVPVNYVAEGGAKEEPKKVAEGGSKPEAKKKKESGGMSAQDVLWSQDRSDGHFLLWRVKGDEVIQIADVYLTKTPEHPGGFVKSAERGRKFQSETISGTEFLSYLTPPPHNNRVDLFRIFQLPSTRLTGSRPWVRKEVLKNLEDLGYTGHVILSPEGSPTKAELDAEPEPLEGQGVEHRKAPPKPKRVDNEEVVKLLAELEKAKQEDKDHMDAWIAGGRKGKNRSLEFLERIHGLEKKISKARAAQTRAAKKAEPKEEVKEEAKAKPADIPALIKERNSLTALKARQEHAIRNLETTIRISKNLGQSTDKTQADLADRKATVAKYTERLAELNTLLAGVPRTKKAAKA